MKRFANYLHEAAPLPRYTTIDQVQQAIAEFKKAGEILNPVYQNLLYRARKVFEVEAEVGKKLILDVMHGEGLDNRSSEINDLYYAWPWDSFAGLGKFEKLISKLPIKPAHSQTLAAAKQLVKNWKPIADDLKALKGKVVKVTTKRLEVKAAAAADMDKKKGDSVALIRIFESHMGEYIQMAKVRAKKFLDDKLDVLKQHGWDLNLVAPQPRSSDGSTKYLTAKAKRQLYQSITTSKESSRRPGAPDIRVANTQMINHYIQQSADGAEQSYRAFMEKMINKIGKNVTHATMVGSIWTNTILTVDTEDGEQQVWHTKMILNFSKYEKMFNQFPSRRKI